MGKITAVKKIMVQASFMSMGKARSLPEKSGIQ